MIASILYSSPTFEAVDYNERKVAQGDATLLVAENFGYLDKSKGYTAASLKQYLTDYSKRNERIQKPQMHVAFSCRGQEMNNDELVAYARQWLKEMGYDNPKQPLLIYSHNDTDNNHIHVITSRVDPEGKKIKHNHERVRSKAFVERTLGVDTSGEMEQVLQSSLGYKFESASQWQAVLEASGYSVIREDETMKIAKNGAYQHTISAEVVEGKVSKGYAEKNRLKQLKALLLKHRDMTCEKEELQRLMKRKFGVDLMFFGGKDNPRGYFVVDHKNKAVYKGSSVLNIAQLLTFESKEEKLKRIDAFVDAQLEANPQLTGKELHQLLKRHYSAGYRGGVIFFEGQEIAIRPYMAEALQYNFKLEKIHNTFVFHTEEEKSILAKLFNVNVQDIGESKFHGEENTDVVETVREAAAKNTTLQDIQKELEKHNIRLLKSRDRYFAVGFSLSAKTNTICCLDEQGILLQNKAERSQHHSPQQQDTGKQKPRGWQPLRPAKQSGGGSRAANREWEVGTQGRYDEIDDARTLKR